MSKKVHGLENGLTNYGDIGFACYLRRSFAKSMGYTDASLDKPIVGICYTESDFNNCHRHFPEILEVIKRGVLASGALPVAYPIMSLGELFLSPTSMGYRNLMAMAIAVEEMIAAQPMDSVVLLGGCDKTVPALLLGAASAGKPATMVVAGPMMTGRHKGECLDACTDCRRFWAKYRAGTVEEQEINQIEGRFATTAGTCAVMGTASSIAVIAETLGTILPGSAGIPAVHADRLRNSEETGVVAAKMALSEDALTPDKIMTREAVENSSHVLLAVFGSTNAIIHLTAVAGRLGIDISLDRMNELSDETPVVVDLKPVGQGYMEDFHSAGGLDGVLDAIKEKVHRSPINIEGISLGGRLDAPKADPFDHKVIRTADNPIDS